MMYFKKSFLCSIPVGIALALELAIPPRAASQKYFSVSSITSGRSPLVPLKNFTSGRSPLVPLKKGEIEAVLALHSPKEEIASLLAPLVKGGWGDLPKLDTQTPPQALKTKVSQLKQANPPPPPDNPDSSAAGGRRAPAACPQDAEIAKGSPLLTALSPMTKPGLTLANPTFLVYVPKTSAKNAEFSLSSRDGRGVYRTTIALTKTPDFVSISLPPQAPPLEVGKQYTWTFAIICNPDDRLADQFVTGSVQRTELAPTQKSQIEQTPASQRLALYEKDGIWYDAIALLFELKRSQPNDPSLNAAWREFLRSGGIDLTI